MLESWKERFVWEPGADEIREIIAEIKLPRGTIELRGSFMLPAEERPSLVVSVGRFHREILVPFKISRADLAMLVTRAYAMISYDAAFAEVTFEGKRQS